MSGPRSRPPLIIAKAGSTLAPLLPRRGDFEDWIVQGMGLAPRDFEVLEVQDATEWPSPLEVGGLVITGSPAMVSDREEWSERCAQWLPAVVDSGCPVLGICFGHQLLAHAMGGRVGPNPAGREMGTATLQLESAQGDALFDGLPSEITAQTTHWESVLELPPGARRLAWNARDAHHAYFLQPRAWGLQFHPEFDSEIMAVYLEERRSLLEAEGHDAGQLLASLEESPWSRLLLRRFARVVADNWTSGGWKALRQEK